MTHAPLPSAPKAEAAPLTERRYLLPFLLVISLFFLWAFGVNLNDILIPHLKRAFGRPNPSGRPNHPRSGASLSVPFLTVPKVNKLTRLGNRTAYP